MRTNYLRYLANIIDIQWSRPIGRGGGTQLPIELVNLLYTPKKCGNFEVADKHNAVLEVIDEQAILEQIQFIC